MRRKAPLGAAALIFLLDFPGAAAETLHPLDPLSGSEIAASVAALKADPRFPEGALFPILVLKEPTKEEEKTYDPNKPRQRQAFAVVLDRPHNKTFETVVEVEKGRVLSWKEIPGVQPAFLVEELTSAPEIVRADPLWQEAMKKRGITDFKEVQIDGWAPGTIGVTGAEGPRLVRALSFYKGKSSNFYARPVEGVVAVVDMNRRRVIRLEDAGLVPLSRDDGAFDEKTVGRPELAAKPLEIAQPQGPGFEVRGREVRWGRWRLRFALHPREGPVLYGVGFEDSGRVRPILHRASLSEMVVPYGDPADPWAWRSAFDVGEYGIGRLASPLEPGTDAPENAVFFDADFVDDFGKAYRLPRAMALYERDGGLLWKHYTIDPESNESRRARELVLACIVTVGNYDYGLKWIFREDATMEFQADLTGIMLAKGVLPAQGSGHEDHFGHRVSKAVSAPHHQHFFNFRLDFDVDGPRNALVEMNARALPKGPRNPHGNAFVMEEKPLGTELGARRDMSLAENRKWLVTNPGVLNALGGPVGYALIPGENSVPYLLEDSAIRRRAGFVNHHLWATRFKPEEINAAGYYINQSSGGDGLERWTSDDEALDGQDLVLWYTFGVTHIPRPEEWPIMPVTRAGFKLVPVGFFPRNPALGIPRPAAQPGKK